MYERESAGSERARARARAREAGAREHTARVGVETGPRGRDRCWVRRSGHDGGERVRWWEPLGLWGQFGEG
jgi:hypothetical protein